MAFFADGETDTVSANGSVSFCNCCMPRRRFLVGLAAATAMSSRRAFAQAPEAKPAGKRIDVHHHFLPPQYMKEEHERINFGHGGVSASQMLTWTPSQSLEVMDQNGIATAIVSITTPGVWFGDVAAGRRLFGRGTNMRPSKSAIILAVMVSSPSRRCPTSTGASRRSNMRLTP